MNLSALRITANVSLTLKDISLSNLAISRSDMTSMTLSEKALSLNNFLKVSKLERIKSEARETLFSQLTGTSNIASRYAIQEKQSQRLMLPVQIAAREISNQRTATVKRCLDVLSLTNRYYYLKFIIGSKLGFNLSYYAKVLTENSGMK